MDPSSPPLPRVTIHLLFQLQGGTWLGVTGKSFWPRSTCRGCVQPHGIWQGWNHSSLLQSGIVQLVIASWLPFSEWLQDVIPNWTEIHPVHLCTWHGKELRCCSRGPASKWSKVRNLHAGNYIETWQEPGLTVAAAETEDTWKNGPCFPTGFTWGRCWKSRKGLGALHKWLPVEPQEKGNVHLPGEEIIPPYLSWSPSLAVPPQDLPHISAASLPLSMGKLPILCILGDAHKKPLQEQWGGQKKSQYTLYTSASRSLHQGVHWGGSLGVECLAFLVPLPLPLALEIPDLVKIVDQHHRCGRKVSEIQCRGRLAFLGVREKGNMVN